MQFPNIQHKVQLHVRLFCVYLSSVTVSLFSSKNGFPKETTYVHDSTMGLERGNKYFQLVLTIRLMQIKVTLYFLEVFRHVRDFVKPEVHFKVNVFYNQHRRFISWGLLILV